MSERAYLLLAVCVWFIIAIAAIRNQWRQQSLGSGLLTAYIFNLALIHLFGALIYTFSWYTPQSPYLIATGSVLSVVAAGFFQSTYGIIGLYIGSFILAPQFLKNIRYAESKDVISLPILTVARTYMLAGILCYFVLQPLLGSIPSVSSIVSSGLMVFVAGACLGTWHSQNGKGLSFYLGLACFLPVITILTQGFVGFGARAASIILIFAMGLYRPRWRVVVAILFAILIGLSFFVTYMRDRTLIRNVVWSGYGNETKFERLFATMQDFEIINPFNQQHLEAIDVRLNQNVLIGQAVYTLSHSADYAKGSTLFAAVTAWVPRVIWPGKPFRAGGNDLVSRYSGRRIAVGTSWGPGPIFESYINFGTIGVLLIMTMYGIVLRTVDFMSGQKLLYGDWKGFIIWFLPGIGLINPGGTFAEVVALVSSSVVLVLLINKLFIVPPSRTATQRAQSFEIAIKGFK